MLHGRDRIEDNDLIKVNRRVTNYSIYSKRRMLLTIAGAISSEY
jgi:hypothetical protein